MGNLENSFGLQNIFVDNTSFCSNENEPDKTNHFSIVLFQLFRVSDLTVSRHNKSLWSFMCNPSKSQWSFILYKEIEEKQYVLLNKIVSKENKQIMKVNVSAFIMINQSKKLPF